MDIVRFKGGLGNQMFQYALVEALRSRGREVRCSLGYYRKYPERMPFVLDKVFPNVDMQEIDDSIFNGIDDKWKRIKQDKKRRELFEKELDKRFFWVEENAYIFYPTVFQTNECAYVGWWQSEKYFSEIKSRIKQVFQFTVKEDKLSKLAEELRKGYVGIHVRRGDYLLYPHLNICSLKYYQDAIAEAKRILPNSKYIFFTNDVEWVRSNLSMDDMIICTSDIFERYEDWYDMYLMTQCCMNIIPNSTFSWWGAWLNQNPEKKVISPNVWCGDRETPDIWCSDWIKLEV